MAVINDYGYLWVSSNILSFILLLVRECGDQLQNVTTS